jgi:hypothetical protein
MFPWKQLNRNTITVFSVRSDPRCYNRDTFTSQLSWKEPPFKEALSPEVAIVRNRYQTTTTKDSASCKTLSVCSSD